MVYQLKTFKISSQTISSITVVIHNWFLAQNNRITVLLLELALKTLCLRMDYYWWYLVGKSCTWNSPFTLFVGGLIFGGKFVLVIRGDYIRGGLYLGFYGIWSTRDRWYGLWSVDLFLSNTKIPGYCVTSGRNFQTSGRMFRTMSINWWRFQRALFYRLK